MKHFKFISILLLAAMVGGCEKSPASNDASAADQLEKVKQDTKQTTQDMKDFTYAQKDEFVKKMQGELDTLNQELTDLTAKVEKASDAAKADAKPKLDALKAQIADLNADMDKAKNSTASTWEDVKAGAQKAMDKTTAAFKEAGDWIKKQTGN